jgi:crotonobetainyl-CoA:carnitine CoA-transferase CaiB-like acyl-CoA transferase
MGDHPTGMSLFAAIMAGLYHRERTGRGTMVSTSLLANGLWMNAIPVQGILCGARTEVRPPRGDAISALAQPVPLPGRALVHADDHGRRASLGELRSRDRP